MCTSFPTYMYKCIAEMLSSLRNLQSLHTGYDPLLEVWNEWRVCPNKKQVCFIMAKNSFLEMKTMQSYPKEEALSSVFHIHTALFSA